MRTNGERRRGPTEHQQQQQPMQMTMFILQLAIMCECARTSFISRMLKIRIDERMAIYSALGCEQLRIAICITFHQNIHYKMIERMNELTKNERAFGI